MISKQFNLFVTSLEDCSRELVYQLTARGHLVQPRRVDTGDRTFTTKSEGSVSLVVTLRLDSEKTSAEIMKDVQAILRESGYKYFSLVCQGHGDETWAAGNVEKGSCRLEADTYRTARPPLPRVE